MTTLYWLALVLGGGLALLSLFGDMLGLDGDAAADAAGGDADLGHAGDLGGHHGGGAAAGHDGMHILSLRSATYFLFAFGAVGVLLQFAWGGRQPWLGLLAAASTGAAAAFFSAALFGWVARTGSGELPSDRTLAGLAGTMVLPLREGGGKVQVVRGGREYELLARPFDPAAPAPESWTSVVVVEVVDGTALVTPLDIAGSDPFLPSAPQESA